MATVHGLTEEQQAEYDAAIGRGESHNIAEIVASGKPPGMDLKDERWRLGDERAEWGKEVPKGKYQSGLARYPGDPEAFVSSRADARRLAQKRGLRIIDGPANRDNPRQRAAK